ncbi:unnamed protein product [Schistosoma spindalis]|nr:unnamed protein product [Schistosoma spindale]
MKHSLCNNFYSSFITNTSDLTTMMMMLKRKKRTNPEAAAATTTTTTTQKDNKSMTIEHIPTLNHHHDQQTTTNILSLSNITENQLNIYKKEYYREHQRYKRASLQYRYAHAARERQRVAEFNKVFKKLHSLLPTNNHLSNRRLSKLQILKLCSSYIYYLTCLLQNNNCNDSTLNVQY